MIIKKFFSYLKYFDWYLFFSVIFLIIMGLAAIYSIALSKENPDFYFFKRQLIFVGLGVFFLFLFSFIDYKVFKVYSWFLYIVSAVLLVLVLFFGSDIRGTSGWFSIFGLGIQPVEFAKLSLICVLSKYFSNKQREVDQKKYVLVSGSITLFFVGLVLLQPDLGSAIILFSIWFAFLLIFGIKKEYIFVLLLIIIVVSVLSWTFLFKDYQKERILTFIDPSRDPMGRGYNVTQSIIAIGSGNIFGRGLGEGSQSQLQFIPESQTDFIFAVIGEELGFIGSLLVLFFFTTIFYRLIKASKKAKDNFSLYFVLGIIVLFFMQMLINIGMNMGIMPVTGISLPFISYGGSFLLISMTFIGIVESYIIRN